MLRLKELRRAKGISMKELGEILGVSESTVSLYENMKREAPYSLLKRMAIFFGVSIDYILGFDSPNLNFNIPILESVTIENNSMFLNFSNSEAFELDGNQEHFFLRIYDNSMEPQISNGDLALIKKGDEIKSGEVAAVIFKDSSVSLRRVIMNDESIVLQAFNPKTESVFIKDKSELIILGRVIQTVKKW